jgi:hypothetical protein
MTLKTSLWALQQALVQRLDSDTALNERITGVFDDVEKGTAFPYITIGEPTADPFETKSSFGEEVAVVLDCWSRYAGKKEAYEILNLMLQAITRTPLPIEGFTLVRTRLQQMTVITDIDNETRHGIMRMRFTINN